MIARLVECSDYDMFYGILEVEGKDEDEVQQMIRSIKTKFYEEGFDDWCVEDVFEEFPDDWEWSYISDAGILAI